MSGKGRVAQEVSGKDREGVGSEGEARGAWGSKVRERRRRGGRGGPG